MTLNPTLLKGLRYYFPFNESGRNVLRDMNPQFTDVSTVEGRSGQAYSFNGTSSHIYFPDNLVNFPTSLTISFWFKLSNLSPSSSYCFVQQVSSSNVINFKVYVNTATNPDQFNVTLNGVFGQGAGNAALDDTLWHHVAIINSGSTVTVYVDGEDSGSFTRFQSEPFPLPPRTEGLYIGANRDNSDNFVGFFEGTLDEIALYHRVLSVDEIAKLYNGGFPNAFPFQQTNNTSLRMVR